MDYEHQVCTDSFNRTVKDPTLENLQELYDIIKLHFEHEEELIRKYSNKSNNGSSSSFSAIDSHINDHKRILAIAERELDRKSQSAAARAGGTDGGSSSCNDDGGAA